MKSFNKYLTIIICFVVLCLPIMFSSNLISALNLNSVEENKNNAYLNIGLFESGEYVLKLHTGSTIFKTLNCTYNQEIDLTQPEYIIEQRDNLNIYKFLGWWDNINFSGNKITVLKIKEDTNLYAKFHTISISSLNKQKMLIILGSLIGLNILIFIFASFKTASFKGIGRKFSRNKASKNDTEQEIIKIEQDSIKTIEQDKVKVKQDKKENEIKQKNSKNN